MALTFSASSRGWTTLRWLEADDAQVVPLALDLSLIPGTFVNLEHRSAEVPQSAWGLPLWQQIAAPLGWRSPMQPSSPWLPARRLYEHQRVGVEFLCRQGGGLLADQMGLGKTTTAIVSAERLAQAESPDSARLIVAPGFTRDVWLRELLALGAISRPEEFCAVRTRNPFDASFRPQEARWWFVHYDVAEDWASRLVTNARGRPVVAIVDEAHWIKNGKAKRSKGVAVAAGVAACRLLLSGTPLLNKPSELWHLLTVLDGPRSWGSPVEFRQRYCGAFHDGHGWQDSVMPTNQGELLDRVSRRYLRRTLDDAGMDLPELTRSVYEVDPEDRASIDAAFSELDRDQLHEILDALDRGAFGTEILRALSRLAKATSRAKIPQTVEYLRGLLEQGEQAVVFCHERATAQRIAALLGDDTSPGAARPRWAESPSDPRGESPWAFVATGDDPQERRDEVVSRFQAGERSVVCTTYGAMREGVTLHRARHVVLHDLAWRPADVLQAEARVHRIGQRRAATSTWMIVRDSFDTLLARALIRKGESIARTLGDHAAEQAFGQLRLDKYTGPGLDDEAQRLIAGYWS